MITTPLLQVLFPNIIFRMPKTKQKSVYLTFDDGPHVVTTMKIADILAQFNAKATFFVIGEKINGNQDIIQKLSQAGHSICNHSYSHNRIRYLSKSSAYFEIQQSQHLIEQNTDNPGKFFRPPHGWILPNMRKIVNQLNLKIVLWDTFIPDYRPGYTTQKIIQRVVNHSKDGSIVLLHDNSKNSNETVKALPLIIRQLNDRGFKLLALSNDF